MIDPAPLPIFEGLYRPPLEELRRTVMTPNGFFECPCGVGFVVNQALLFDHWRAGHFDIPEGASILAGVREIAEQLRIMNARNAARDDIAVSELLDKVGLDPEGNPK